MIRIRLREILDRHPEITRNALAREAKLRPNLIYDMYDGKTKRIDLETLDAIISKLNEMGAKVSISDLLTYEPNNTN